MLRTGKQVWEATAKRRAIDLRNEELNFHMQRFTVLLTQSSILVGFAFESIVHLEVPEDCDPIISTMFFGGLAACVILSLYVIVVGSTLMVFASQLATLGADGDSLELAVDQLRARRVQLFGVGFLSLIGLFLAAIALAWIKMPFIAHQVTLCFLVLGVVIMFSVLKIYCAMGRRRLVTGSTQFITPEGYFDLATLQPNVGNPKVLSDVDKLDVL
mmetsp:Transcript_45297/g.118903  ORF Transcript_45297/g.118903 Transcript_45297/m.118903 type:complete len:215 (+) Transcript_45297:76-720(+)